MTSARCTARSLTLAVVLLLPPAVLTAQLDYRNLERARPARTEDAYAIERHAFEALAGWRWDRAADGSDTHVIDLELEHGLWRNGEVGFDVPLTVRDDGSGSSTGLGGVAATVLYNFNSETRRLPAFGLRAEAELPVGSLGPDHVLTTVRGIATRSWGRTRLHLNGAWVAGPTADEPRWEASAAIDRTLLRQSVLLVAEVSADGRDHAETVATALVGARWQWTPTLVLDAALARRLTAGGPDAALTVGLSKVFGIAGLVRVPTNRPAPPAEPAHRHEH